ncbi:MAG: hypothetical protein MUC65_07805 [Pontiellaceae bacterium]|jgi:hypothetical protein|nr:hypothetical protein [Pontiellaceae bacterium]
MKPKVYIETSVISSLTSRETRKIPAAAWRQATLDWRNTRRRPGSENGKSLSADERRWAQSDGVVEEWKIGMTVLNIPL